MAHRTVTGESGWLPSGIAETDCISECLFYRGRMHVPQLKELSAMQMLPFQRLVPVTSEGQLEVIVTGWSLLPAVFPCEVDWPPFLGASECMLMSLTLSGDTVPSVHWKERTQGAGRFLLSLSPNMAACQIWGVFVPNSAPEEKVVPHSMAAAASKSQYAERN